MDTQAPDKHATGTTPTPAPGSAASTDSATTGTGSQTATPRQRLQALMGRTLDYFNISSFLIPQAQAEATIREGVSFRGINLLILIIAIFIASLGLNTNSTAVIIGAMLISPPWARS